MSEMYVVEVIVTLVVHGSEQYARENGASFAEEEMANNGSAQAGVLNMRRVRSLADLPPGWADSLPYTESGPELTCRQILFQAEGQ